MNSRFTFSYGVRWETQNWISDKDDWAPRLSLAYALDEAAGKTAAKDGIARRIRMVLSALHCGQRVWRERALRHQHDSRKRRERAAVHSDVGQSIVLTSTRRRRSQRAHRAARRARMRRHSTRLLPNFHAANDMEAAIGVDRQVTKSMTGERDVCLFAGSASVLHRQFERGGRVSAFENALSDTYPADGSAAPATNNLQYQSGGFYREHQIMATVRATYRKFSFVSELHLLQCPGRHKRSGFGAFGIERSWTGLWANELRCAQSLYAFRQLSTCRGRYRCRQWSWPIRARLSISPRAAT